MEQGGFHGGLAFLSVAQETVVVRWERPECDGEMDNRLINCRPYRGRKQICLVVKRAIQELRFWRVKIMSFPHDSCPNQTHLSQRQGLIGLWIRYGSLKRPVSY